MATPKRWAVREAADVTFYDLVTKLPVVTLNTLKMTDVETSGETTYARGGRGNAKLVGFSSDREASMTLQDAIFDNDAMAILTGNPISPGARTIELFEDVQLDASGAGTLTKAALASPAPIVHKLNGNALGEVDTAATVAGKAITDGTANGRVRVYFSYTTPADTQTIRVSSDNFGGTYKVVADVLVRDEETKQDFYAQFIAYNAKIEDNFSFSFSPDGDPSVLDIPLEILKAPGGTNMWEFVIYGDAED